MHSGFLEFSSVLLLSFHDMSPSPPLCLCPHRSSPVAALGMRRIINTNTHVPAKTHGGIPYMVVNEDMFGLCVLKR